MKKTALVLIFSFFLILVSLLIKSPAFAQVNPYNAPDNNPDVPRNMHTYTQNVMIEVLSALNCQISGIDIVNPNQDCLGVDSQTGKIGFVKNGGGAIGMMGSLIAATYNPPIHTSDYIAYLSQNFGVAKPAYAQGLGFQGITPLVKIWSVFRNVVYLVFVIVFVVIGLAIMLRVKIDPRTVMSIENQIPKIIISLLLVTFSFAIAGFLIDMMYVLIFLIFNLFHASGAIANPDGLNKVQQSFNGDNVLGVFNNMLGYYQIVVKASDSVRDVVSTLFTVAKPESWFDVGRNILVGLIGVVGFFLAFLIIGIALLWALFRIWFMLISSYVFILLDIITAPFWMLFGAFPGGGLGFTGWLRDFLANLITFPATIGMFLAGRAFMDALAPQSGITPNSFVPPLVGNINQGTLSSLIGLGIILLTPDINNILKKAFKAPKFDMSMIFKALSVGSPTGIIGSASQLGSTYFGLTHFGNLGKGIMSKVTRKNGR